MDSKIAIDANSKMFIFPSQLEKYSINFILEGEAKLRNMFYVRMIYFGIIPLLTRFGMEHHFSL
jgi:hypothetical protein